MRKTLPVAFAAVLLSLAFTIPAHAQADQPGYLEGALRCGVESFDKLDTSTTCQGQITARVAFAGGSFGLAARADSAQKSGLPEFSDPDLWRTVDVHVLPFLRVAATADGYDVLIAPELTLSFAITDTLDRFGKKLDARPKRAGGCVIVRNREAYVAGCLGRDDLSAAGRWAAFGTIDRQLSNLSGMPVAVSVDFIAPFNRVGDDGRFATWAVQTGVKLKFGELGAR